MNVNTMGTTSSAQASSGLPKSNGDSVKEQKDQFLTMMLAQMRNQDPLDPMDPADFSTQMAQFTQVESLQNLTGLMEQNNISMDTLQVLQTAKLAGTTVSVPTTQIDLASDESLKGYADLEVSGEKVEVIARNPDGTVAEKVDLGRQTVGRVEFEIPELEAGKYDLEVNVINGEESFAMSPVLERRIEKVTPGTGGDTYLDVSGIGNISLFSIQEFLGGLS